MSKQELKVKGVMEKEEIISKLQDMLQAMSQGELVIHDQQDMVVLRPGQFIEMEIKVKSKKEKEKLQIELSWRSDKEVKVKPVEFSIAAQAPDQEESKADLDAQEDAVLDNLESEQEESRTPAASAPPIAAQEEKGESYK